MKLKKNFLASNLKYLSALKGMTQTQLSVELGFANSTISNYINKKSEPDPDKLLDIAAYFNITVDHLIGKDLTGDEISLTAMDEEEVKITRELVAVIARYEKALRQLEQSKTATEEDYNALWETVRRLNPELARRLEQEMQRK